MQICLMVEGQDGVTWDQWVTVAQACEKHKIPVLFRSDHYLNLHGHTERGSLDAWATLTALAAVTTTVRLGTLVSPATFRHPSNLAKLVATADQVSGGRIELGLGAGWHDREHAAYGFPYPPLGERLDVLEEQLQVVTGALTETPFSFAGQHYQLDALDMEPKAVQQPRPPLIMGGQGRSRSVSLAARYADEYNTPFGGLEQVVERRAAVAVACEAIGREPIPFSVMTCVITGRDEDEIRRRLVRFAERFGQNPGEGLDGPPPGWVVGTVDQVAERLRALRDAGVIRVMCQHMADLDSEIDHMHLLGCELAPLVA
jgi:F420-dependent oxidoreductase-like protein